MFLSPERFTVAVRPGGTWGAVWALVAAEQGHLVKLHLRNVQDCKILNKTHTYRRVPGVIFPENIYATTNPDETLENADVLAIASRSQDVRELVRSMKGWKPKRGIVNLSKGLEEGTNYRISQVIQDEQPDWIDMYASWSGPNIAGRIAVGEQAEAHIASTNPEVALFFERFFGRGRITLFPTPDVIGTEYGGSLKNIRVMAVGLIFGLGWEKIIGDYVRDQGRKETIDIGVAYGASRETFDGPSGEGDFKASVKFRSRNFKAGFKMGSEHKTADDLKNSGETYEGLSTIKPTLALAQQACVDAIVTKMVDQAAFPKTPQFLKI